MHRRMVRHVARRTSCWAGSQGPNYVSPPNAHHRLWILDVDGTRLVIGGSWFPDTSQQDLDDLDTILNSIQIDPVSRPSRPATTIRSKRPQRPPPHLRKTIEQPTVVGVADGTGRRRERNRFRVRASSGCQ